MPTQVASIAVILSLISIPAWSQDFGTGWIDDITQELQEERGVLDPRPVEFQAWGGLVYQYDSNIFLEDGDEDGDSIIIPYARARLEYTEERFDFMGDLLFNYKFYSDEDDGNDHEERLAARARFTDARYSFDLAQTVLRLSDPIDAVFQDRVARTVSTTNARLAFDLTEVFFFEASGKIQDVHWQDDPFEDWADNNNAHVDGAFGWRTPYGFELLAQVGWYGIFYSFSQSAGAPPDVDGMYVRGGFRHDLLPDLHLEALGGYTRVASEDFESPAADGKEHSTGDGSVHVRYEAIETVTITGGYTRLITFATTQRDPYQVVNRVLLRGDWQADPQVSAWARIHSDRSTSSQGIRSRYTALSGGGVYTLNPQVAFDATLTFRAGEVGGSVTRDHEYDGYVFSVGAVVTY